MLLQILQAWSCPISVIPLCSVLLYPTAHYAGSGLDFKLRSPLFGVLPVEPHTFGDGERAPGQGTLHPTRTWDT